MTVPLWAPWVLTFALAWPSVLLTLREDGQRASKLVWAPAVLLLVVSVSMTFDQRRVSQDELERATELAAGAMDGSFGPVGNDRVKVLIEAELGHEVWVDSSEATVESPLAANYSIEVRLTQDDAEPATCINVALKTVSSEAHDLRIARVDAMPGPCTEES